MNSAVRVVNEQVVATRARMTRLVMHKLLPLIGIHWQAESQRGGVASDSVAFDLPGAFDLEPFSADRQDGVSNSNACGSRI